MKRGCILSDALIKAEDLARKKEARRAELEKLLQLIKDKEVGE